MPGAYLWAWDGANWIKVECDINGYLKVDMSEISLGDLSDVVIDELADGHFLSWSAGLGYWQNRLLAEGDIPAGILDKSCRVYNSENISIPNNEVTTLTFDSERWDTDSIHDLVTNPERLTCKTAGRYVIMAQAQFYINTTGRRMIRLRVNGFSIGFDERNPVTVGANSPLLAQTIFDFAVGDYVTVQVYQTSGNALNILSVAKYSPEFMMARIA